MKLSSLLKMMSAVVIVLSLITMASIFMLRLSFNEQREAVARQAEFKQLGLDLVNASLYLTNEAREYSIFGEVVHFDNYQREVTETKTREKVLQRLAELNAPKEELDLIKQAIANSNELAAQEEEAFAAVKAKDLPKARLLMFGSTYQAKQKFVMDPIMMFQEKMNARVKSEADAAIQQFHLIQWIASTLVFVLITLILCTFYLLHRKVTKPLQLVTEVANQVAEGNLQVAVPEIKKKDEIGILAAAVNQMVVNLRQVIEQVTLSTEQVAASSQQLSASIEQSTATTTQIAKTMQEVALGAEAQVQGAEAGAASLKELAEGIQRVAETSSVVSDVSRQTAKEAAEGNESIERAVRQIGLISHSVNDLAAVVKVLDERSEEIGQIVEVINSISAQTNLLALNAAIEAARAGEQGRGFAVVADEVRKLAEQSQASASQIAGLIHDIQVDTARAMEVMAEGTKEVEVGRDVVEEAGQAFRRILEAAQQAAAQIQEVSAASVQMTAGSQQAATAVEEMTRIAAQSADHSRMVSGASEEQLATMQQLSATAESLSHMAQELSDAIKTFKL
ncbi:methyl-accepting chemotaxis protein [Brevibacillus sp. H7]|uniref:methyl-accepting chemotaxis protein n=1 Tax=Brevibacillus sp. H7 TaxID=3349138 RepID=UPI00382AE489